MNKYTLFLQFLNKGSAAIFLIIFIRTTYVIKFSIYLCYNVSPPPFRATFCFTDPDDPFPHPNYSELARVYYIPNAIIPLAQFMRCSVGVWITPALRPGYGFWVPSGN
jgi:hypothetical protein